MSLGSIALVAGKFTLPDDVLKISLAEPFKKPRGWAFWAFWGFLVAPLVVGLTDTAVSTLGYDVRPPWPHPHDWLNHEATVTIALSFRLF